MGDRDNGGPQKWETPPPKMRDPNKGDSPTETPITRHPKNGGTPKMRDPRPQMRDPRPQMGTPNPKRGSRPLRAPQTPQKRGGVPFRGVPQSHSGGSRGGPQKSGSPLKGVSAPIPGVSPKITILVGGGGGTGGPGGGFGGPGGGFGGPGGPRARSPGVGARWHPRVGGRDLGSIPGGPGGSQGCWSRWSRGVPGLGGTGGVLTWCSVPVVPGVR